MKREILVFLITFSISWLCLANEQFDIELRKHYQKECKEIQKYAIGTSMGVDCYLNYHHYNANAYKSQYLRKDFFEESNSDIKIAEFNVLHPGMSKTRYKDYKKIAQLINKWDIIGITELLPLLSSDLKHNEDLVQFVEVDAPTNISSGHLLILNLKKELRTTTSVSEKEKISSKIEEEEAKIKYYLSEIDEAKKHYRKPGYLKILDELHNLRNGSDWALILSPKGEAAKPTDVHELVGYYYRASKVMPKENEYCKSLTIQEKGPSIACIALMDEQILKEDKKDIFSRRPFLAEFQAGNFSFALLTSHVVYNSPKDEDLMANILQKSFKVNHYKDLGVGINSLNYARFAEVKVMLEFMQELRTRFDQKDIILLGDLNLESANKFWPNILDSMPGSQLYNDQRSSISERRYNSRGVPTDGLASDYDHMIFDPRETSECISDSGNVEVKVENFYEGVTGRFVKRLYEVRTEKQVDGTYTVNQKKYDSLIKRFITPYRVGKEVFYTIGKKSIKTGNKMTTVKGVIEDENLKATYLDYFQERVLDSQLVDKTYYSFFTEVLSDHMPIYMSCKTN